MNNPFFNEGIHKGKVEITHEQVTPEYLKPSRVTTFTEICKEYVLFTHAPLLLHGGLNFDPLVEFIIKNSHIVPKVLVLDEQIFDGLETDVETTFNHLLFGLPIKVWDDFAIHMGTIGVKDTAKQMYFSVILQKLPMPDYLALRHVGVLTHKPQMVEIYATALDGNYALYHFQPAINPPIDRIKLIQSKPRQETIIFATSMFKPKKDK